MMDNQKKYAGNHGRKPKPDKMRHRYVFRLDDGDNARFLALFDESGKATKACVRSNPISLKRKPSLSSTSWSGTPSNWSS